MSKAVLVIDIPKSCDECPLMFRHEEERCCIPEGRNSFTIKPNWCPLKPAPKMQKLWSDDETDAWIRGYNNCVREIMSEYAE